MRAQLSLTPASDPARVRALLPWAIAAGLVTMAAGTALFRGALFDDAYIAFRFSENWAIDLLRRTHAG